MKRNKAKSAVVGLIVLGIIAILVVSIIGGPVVTIKSGTIGVQRRFGKVIGVMQPGLNFKIPFVDEVLVYNTQKIIYETSDYPEESNADYTDYPVDTTTKDGQPIHIKYTIRFGVNPEKAEWLASNLGNELQIVEKVVKTDSRVHVRGIARNYAAGDLYTGNVTQLEEDITDMLKPIFEENGLILDEFGIRGIEFSEEYVNAIEQKQIEKERVTTEKYKAEQEEYKKQQVITQAEAEAEKQKLLQSTITDKILLKMYIEKWDGTLPSVVCGNAQNMILDLQSLMDQ